MSYISAIRTGDDVLVWERVPEGTGFVREQRTIRAPYYFYVKDEDGDYTSMYGDKLRRCDYNTAPEMQRARTENESYGTQMFESDIPPELRVLSERYYDVQAPSLHITFIDIEVDYLKELGFASAANPYAPINSVAMYHVHQKRYVVLAVPPNLAPHHPTDDDYKVGDADEEFMNQLNKDVPLPDGYTLDVRLCANEGELLELLVDEIEDSDVVCGWNSDFFDMPYIGKRLEKHSRRLFNRLSFEGAKKPSYRTVDVFGSEQETLDLSGRISADYMVLFRKYEMAERPSYKLTSIADEMLPDLPKLEYEGSLAELYRENFPFFVRYNIRDTEILHGFEDRLGYVDLANR